MLCGSTYIGVGHVLWLHMYCLPLCVGSRKRRGKVPDDGSVSVQDLFSSGPVSEVGSADPVGNFNAMLDRRDQDVMDKAVAGMKRQIERLVSEGEVYHGKALECLKALRKGCLQVPLVS